MQSLEKERLNDYHQSLVRMEDVLRNTLKDIKEKYDMVASVYGKCGRRIGRPMDAMRKGLDLIQDEIDALEKQIEDIVAKKKAVLVAYQLLAE